MLSNSLAPAMAEHPGMQSLHIAFRGPARDFLSSAAPLAALGRAVPTVRLDLLLPGRDNSGQRACKCLAMLRDAAIEPSALSLW